MLNLLDQTDVRTFQSNLFQLFLDYIESWCSDSWFFPKTKNHCICRKWTWNNCFRVYVDSSRGRCETFWIGFQSKDQRSIAHERTEISSLCRICLQTHRISEESSYLLTKKTHWINKCILFEVSWTVFPWLKFPWSIFPIIWPLSPPSNKSGHILLGQIHLDHFIISRDFDLAPFQDEAVMDKRGTHWDRKCCFLWNFDMFFCFLDLFFYCY